MQVWMCRVSCPDKYKNDLSAGAKTLCGIWQMLGGLCECACHGYMVNGTYVSRPEDRHKWIAGKPAPTVVLLALLLLWTACGIESRVLSPSPQSQYDGTSVHFPVGGWVLELLSARFRGLEASLWTFPQPDPRPTGPQFLACYVVGNDSEFLEGAQPVQLRFVPGDIDPHLWRYTGTATTKWGANCVVLRVVPDSEFPAAWEQPVHAGRPVVGSTIVISRRRWVSWSRAVADGTVYCTRAGTRLRDSVCARYRPDWQLRFLSMVSAAK